MRKGDSAIDSIQAKIAVKYISTAGAVIYLVNLTLLFITANIYGSATYTLDFLGRWVEPWLIPAIAVGLLTSFYWDVNFEKDKSNITTSKVG